MGTPNGVKTVRSSALRLMAMSRESNPGEGSRSSLAFLLFQPAVAAEIFVEVRVVGG
jgi:hypothetical protein